MAGLLDYTSSVAGEVKKNVQGLLADPQQALKDILNNLALKAAASQAKTKAAWATRDPKVMAQNALDSSQTALGFAPLGITAWHGSPHKFDKFSTDKIGTGEGAQAYGHGLYLAENKAVAQDYSKMQPTATPTPNRIWNGVELTPGSPEYHAATLLERSTLPATRKEVSGWIKEAESWPDALKNNPSEQAVLAGWRKTLDVLNSVGKKSEFKVGSNANLYKTDIPDEAVARFLDWDNGGRQSYEKVASEIENYKSLANKRDSLLSKYPASSMSESVRSMTDSDRNLFSSIANRIDEGVKNKYASASEHFKAQGIPGIRYLDGGSRGAGQGSSNFVVFDPEMIRILERNGQSTGAAPWQPGEWRGLLGNN